MTKELWTAVKKNCCLISIIIFYTVGKAILYIYGKTTIKALIILLTDIIDTFWKDKNVHILLFLYTTKMVHTSSKQKEKVRHEGQAIF